jgi:hypothetical protein
MSTHRRIAIFSGALVLAASASADLVGPGFRITAIDAEGHRAEAVLNGTWNGDRYVWESNQTIELWDGQTFVGALNPADETGAPTASAVLYVEDPVVNMTFSVQAGSSATMFMISSALLSFPAITNGQASASAGFSVTDFNGNGATLVGNGPVGGGYTAQYNGFAGTYSGTTYAELIPGVAAGSFGTGTLNQDNPVAGTQLVPGSVTDMSAVIAFTLSAFDLASGTTNFVLTPEPASLSLVLLGLAAVARRRS